MAETIGQRQLRNDNAQIMRRVEAGESFVITRNGRPVAHLTPLDDPPTGGRRPTVGELQRRRRERPAVDVDRWYADRRADDLVFGADVLED